MTHRLVEYLYVMFVCVPMFVALCVVLFLARISGEYRRYDIDDYRNTDEHIYGLDEDKLIIARYDPVYANWIPMPSSVDKLNKKVVCIINHLSKFAIIQRAPAGDLNSVKVYPNPYKSNSNNSYGDSILGEGIVFEGLTSNVNVKIFNIAGELVKKLNESDGDGVCLWDTKNSTGEKVAGR